MFSSKWRTLRDNYTREIKKNKAIQENGGIRRSHGYRHSKLLAFLHESIVRRIDPDAQNNTESLEQDQSSSDSDSTRTHEIKIEPNETITDDSSVMEHCTLNYTGDDVANMSQHLDHDDNLAFYMSTLPMIRHYTMQQKIRFRIGVMNLIQEFANETN